MLLLFFMLKFVTPEVQARFEAVVRCVEKHTQGWHHRPFAKVGFEPHAYWCRGKGARSDCQIAESTRDQPDQYVITLVAMLTRDGDTFGINVRALAVPENGWAAQLGYADADPTGRGFVTNHVTPATFSLRLWRKDEVLELGSNMSWSAPTHNQANYPAFTTGHVGSAHDDLGRWGRSATAFRDDLVARLEQLLRHVETTVRSPAVRKTVYGRYRGGGIPPESIPTPYTDDDRNFVSTEARKQLVKQIATVEKNYLELHAALLAAYPLDRCWP